MCPESWEGSWERGEDAKRAAEPVQGGKRPDTAWGSWAMATAHQVQGLKEADGAALLWILLHGIWQWPSHGIRAVEELLGRVIRANAAPLGSPCPPPGTGLGFGRDVEPRLCSTPGTAGKCSAGASLPLVRLGISSSCCQMSHVAPPPAPAPARPRPAPPRPLPAAPLWLSARGTGISALPFPGWGWETQYVPCPVLDTLMTSQGLRSSD